MSNDRLYALPIDADAQLFDQADLQRNQATQAPVANGPATVRSVSLEPNERLLDGAYKGRLAAVLGREFEELAHNDAIGTMPYYDTAGQSKRDAYVTLADVTVTDPVDGAGTVASFSGVLTRAGTRRTHWRAVETAPTDVGSVFKSSTDPLVGVPASATAVRWYDDTTGTTARATVQSTDTTPSGDVDLFNTADPSFDAPTLIYDLPDYADDWTADPLVYDTLGNSGRTDADGIPQWQHVFDTAHEFEGDVVISNGLLRLTIAEGSGLSAEQYSDGTGTWNSVSVDATSWTPVSVDLRRIGQARVVAETLWEDSGSYEEVTLALHRGETDARVPEGSMASGLQTHLDSIAAGTTKDPQPTVTLVSRSDVA